MTDNTGLKPGERERLLAAGALGLEHGLSDDLAENLVTWAEHVRREAAVLDGLLDGTLGVVVRGYERDHWHLFPIKNYAGRLDDLAKKLQEAAHKDGRG